MVNVQMDSRNADHAASQNRRHDARERDLDFVQKRMKIQWVSHGNLKEKNIIWLSAQDAEELFPSNQPGYVQIANHIYRVAIAKLEPGWVAVGDHRHQEIAESACRIDGALTLTLGAARIERDVPKLLKKISLDLALVDDYVGVDSPIIVTTSELQEKFCSLLKEEYLTPGKTYYLEFPWGAMTATLENFSSYQPFPDEITPYGKIVDSTKMDFSTRSTSQIAIVDQIYSSEIDRFSFSMNLQKRVSGDLSDALPLVFEEAALLHKIYTALQGQVILKGHKIVLSHHSGWDVHIELKKVPLKPLYQTSFNGKDEFVENDYETGYFLSLDSEIELRPSSKIILTDTFPGHAAKMYFQIEDIPGMQTVRGVDHDKELWINLEEFAQKVRKLPHELTINQKIPVELKSGTFLVSLQRVRALSPEVRSPDETVKPVWRVDDNTLIDLTAPSELHLNIMRDDQPQPLKKVQIKITAERFPETGLSKTAERLKKYIREHAPSAIVEKQNFAIETKSGDSFRCTIQRFQTEEELQLARGVKVFGQITDDTEIELFAESTGNVTIVNEVHRDDLEKVRFEVKLKKKLGVGKWARRPLVVGVADMMKRVVKELSKYEYFYGSFTRVIEYDHGWDLIIKLNKVVLQQHSTRDALDNQFYNETCKEAFSLGDQTAIEFIPADRDIIFADGLPVQAKAINLRILGINEDYTDADHTLVRGNWINKEELHQVLAEMDRDFHTGERLMIELQSGKYLLEVREGRALNKEDLGDRGMYRNPWKIDSDTKIYLGAASKVETSIVSTSETYPLKKIWFEVFPENPTEEHVTFKDKEIKKAFRDHMPDKIVLNQVFSLEMKSGEAVRMAIKELEFEKRKWSQGKNGDFGRITDETEIQIAGKEESNIAVQGQPKILEIDDPIKYLEELGLGGIDEQFNQIYRIFFSRSDRLRDEAQKRGTTPIRGVMLYGPPGTGKTTLARHIGDMLGCSGDRLKMITATEIFNMWLGESERNVRKLFEPAREASEKYGDKSPLYIVVVDEIDALLPKRGGGTNKVYDKIVNQFLGEMDGLKQLNNLIVIGITNRKEEIDPAAMRHGRFGAHIEIGLPDKKGRRKIFEIHTRKLSDEGVLADDVDVELLAEKTEKYSGASIEGLIEEASLYTLERLNKHKDLSKKELAAHPDGKVTMEDFMKALEGRKDEEEDMSESVKNMYR